MAKKRFRENEFEGAMTRSKKRKLYRLIEEQNEKKRMMSCCVKLQIIPEAHLMKYRSSVETMETNTKNNTIDDRNGKQLIEKSPCNIDAIVVLKNSAGDIEKFNDRCNSSRDINESNVIDDRKVNKLNEKPLCNEDVADVLNKSVEKIDRTNDRINDRCHEMLPSKGVVAVPEYSIKDIVWCRIKGSCHWPARVERITSTLNGNLMYEVFWYNDYRRSKVGRLQIFKFLENFERFAVKFNDVVGLKTAAFEAMYEYKKQKMK